MTNSYRMINILKQIIITDRPILSYSKYFLNHTPLTVTALLTPIYCQHWAYNQC